MVSYNLHGSHQGGRQRRNTFEVPLATSEVNDLALRALTVSAARTFPASSESPGIPAVGKLPPGKSQ